MFDPPTQSVNTYCSSLWQHYTELALWQTQSVTTTGPWWYHGHNWSMMALWPQLVHDGTMATSGPWWHYGHNWSMMALWPQLVHDGTMATIGPWWHYGHNWSMMVPWPQLVHDGTMATTGPWWYHGHNWSMMVPELFNIFCRWIPQPHECVNIHYDRCVNMLEYNAVCWANHLWRVWWGGC